MCGFLLYKRKKNVFLASKRKKEFYLQSVDFSLLVQFFELLLLHVVVPCCDQDYQKHGDQNGHPIDPIRAFTLRDTYNNVQVPSNANDLQHRVLKRLLNLNKPE